MRVVVEGRPEILVWRQRVSEPREQVSRRLVEQQVLGESPGQRSLIAALVDGDVIRGFPFGEDRWQHDAE